MTDVDSIIAQILSGSKDLAAKLIPKHAKQAIQDIENFVLDSRSDISRWAQELAAGTIDADEFQDLIKGEIDDAVLHGIKRSDESDIASDQLKQGLVNMISSIISIAATAAKA